MRLSIALLLLATGCAPEPCRTGTLYLTLAYTGPAADADRLTLAVTVGDSVQSYARARTPGQTRDTLEIDFRSYPATATIVIAATASQAGSTVGAGQTRATLATHCTALALTVTSATATPADLAATWSDDAAAASDLGDGTGALGDLAGPASGDLASVTTTTFADLAMAAPHDLAVAAPHDLAVAAPHDLAVAAPPVVPDLAAPPPDLSVVVPVIGFTGQSNTAQFPSNTTDPAFTDSCPAGQAMIGFNLAVATDSSGNQLGINRADTRCAAPIVSAAAGGSYTVAWGPVTALPGHGTSDQALVVYQCLSGQFLTGFGSRSGAYLDHLLLACAPIVVANDGSVSVGATIVDTGPGVGGSGGSPFATVFCPTGQVATALRTREAGGAPADAFGYSCSTPVVVH
jgi:hypothetical protein